MKIVRASGPGGPEVLKFEEVSDPEPGSGQVLVRLEAIGVNFADIYARRMAAKDQATLMGREGAGAVEAVGDQVKEFKVGDKVAFADTLGAYAQKLVVAEKRLVPVPVKLTTKQAAASLLQGMTAHYLAVSVFAVESGDVVLVHAAAGGVGGLLVQIAKQNGAMVVGTVSSGKKAQVAQDVGADEVVIYTQKNFEEEVKRITASMGVHVVYDSVGKDTFEKSLNCLRPRGMMVLFGQSSGAVANVDPQVLAAKGSLFLTRPSLKDYTAERSELLSRAAEIFKKVAAEDLKVQIFKEFPLEQAAAAHKALENRETIGKVLLRP
jgi:NADPH2:quinone reductase